MLYLMESSLQVDFVTESDTAIDAFTVSVAIMIQIVADAKKRASGTPESLLNSI